MRLIEEYTLIQNAVHILRSLENAQAGIIESLILDGEFYVRDEEQQLAAFLNGKLKFLFAISGSRVELVQSRVKSYELKNQES